MTRVFFFSFHPGRKIAIDASMCIYQFLIAVRQDGNVLQSEDGETTRYDAQDTMPTTPKSAECCVFRRRFSLCLSFAATSWECSTGPSACWNMALNRCTCLMASPRSSSPERSACFPAAVYCCCSRRFFCVCLWASHHFQCQVTSKNRSDTGMNSPWERFEDLA